MAKSKAIKKKRSLAGRFGRLVARFTKATVLAVVLAALWSGGFIALKCHSATPPRRPSAASVAPDGPLPAGYRRDEASTFLALPEWYVIDNADERARAAAGRPSAFPHVASIGQYWRYYGAACSSTKGVYSFNWRDHLRLAVIGTGFSAEHALTGLYEKTLGRLTEWVSGHDTPEDAFAHATAAEYGRFLHTNRWYEFPFAQKIDALWTTLPAGGPHVVRKWERRAMLTAEYGVKAALGWVGGASARTGHDQETPTTYARIQNAGPAVFADGVVKRVRDVPRGAAIVGMPRNDAFTERTLLMLQQGVRFIDIAGNDDILMTVLAPAGWVVPDPGLTVAIDERLLTDVTTRRIGLRLDVAGLHTAVPKIQSSGARIERLYDY